MLAQYFLSLPVGEHVWLLGDISRLDHESKRIISTCPIQLLTSGRTNSLTQNNETLINEKSPEKTCL